MNKKFTTEELAQRIKEFAYSGRYLYDYKMSKKLLRGLRKIPCVNPSKFYLFEGTNGLEKLRRIMPETFESRQEELDSLLDLTIPLFVKENLYSALWLDAGSIYNPSRKEYQSMATVNIRGLADINPAVTLEICVSDGKIIAETEEHLGASLTMEITRPEDLSHYSDSLFQSERRTTGFHYENGIWIINYFE